jgi:hypothetical protein
MSIALIGALLPADGSAQYLGSGAEVYRLTEIGGVPLPVVHDLEDEGRCREELFSATLTLYDNGSWSLVSRDREVCSGDFVKDVDQDLDEGLFTVEGSTIRFLDRSGRPPHERVLDIIPGDDTGIEDLDVGTLAPGALTVRLENGVVAVFRK